MLHVTTTALLMLAAAQNIGTISPGGIEAIGPKQDDPRAMCEPDGTATTGLLDAGRVRTSSSGGMTPTPGGVNPIIVQGGMEAIGPKQDDPRSPVLAIGPKQDDPSRPGALSRPGDDEDPQARGEGGSQVPGRPGVLSIGPKQDDPRAPVAVVARPGDDEDPQARCLPVKG